MYFLITKARIDPHLSSMWVYICFATVDLLVTLKREASCRCFSRVLRFELHTLPTWQPVWPWAPFLVFLCLSFSSIKVPIKIVSVRNMCFKFKWDMWKNLRRAPGTWQALIKWLQWLPHAASRQSHLLDGAYSWSCPGPDPGIQWPDKELGIAFLPRCSLLLTR